MCRYVSLININPSDRTEYERWHTLYSIMTLTANEIFFRKPISPSAHEKK